MNYDKSYQKLVDMEAINKQIGAKDFVKELYVEMVLTEAALKRRYEIVYKEIDEALSNYDEEKFYILAKELNELNEKFGK